VGTLLPRHAWRARLSSLSSDAHTYFIPWGSAVPFYFRFTSLVGFVVGKPTGKQVMPVCRRIGQHCGPRLLLGKLTAIGPRNY
jgi:hypothetical protein